MTTKIQLSQIVVPQATAGQTITVQAGGTLVASNATVSASASLSLSKSYGVNMFLGF